MPSAIVSALFGVAAAAADPFRDGRAEAVAERTLPTTRASETTPPAFFQLGSAEKVPVPSPR